MRPQLSLVIAVEQFGYGELEMKLQIELLYAVDGKAYRNSCFGDVSHMIKKVLVIYI
jgi:hypothetical protein